MHRKNREPWNLNRNIVEFRVFDMVNDGILVKYLNRNIVEFRV